MLIYICCAGGMTSSLFCKKMAQSAESKDIYFGDLSITIKNFDSLSQQYSLLITYGSEGLIAPANLASIFQPYVDKVFVCPQVCFRTPALKALLEPIHISCEEIDMKTFGMMDGKKVLDKLL